MQDCSSRPKVTPTQTAEALVKRIITHRRQRLCGRHIAELTGVSPAIVSRVLRRAGLKAAERPDPCRACGALCPQGARRADPPRHQETWAI